MFDFIPLGFYTDIYYYYMVVVIIGYSSFLLSKPYLSHQKDNNFAIGLVFIFITLYMGSRPISGYHFGDMGTYARIFRINIYSLEPHETKDWLFDRFIFECSKLMSVEFWFLLCAFLYTLPIYLLSKKYGGNYISYLFLLFIVSFSFWSYGTNGIRNGLASSVFLMAMASNKLPFQVGWLFLACGIHSSLMLPALAFGLTFFVKNPKNYFIGWLLSIPLSLVAGGVFQGLFAGMMDDGRSSYLTEGNINEDNFSSTGFRWDFLLYSAAPVYNAYYFIVKRKWNNPIYNRIVNVYLTSNAFWILVIKANFSNRFAYLSWFMMALVIAYPWVQKEFMPKQTHRMAYILLAYFGFTFLMNVILA